MDEDFATLFEASLKARRFRQGDTIDGTVVGIGADVAFVDVGGKGEATIDLAELKDPDGRLEVAVGDRIQAVVVSTEAGAVVLSRRLARSAATSRQLEEAYHSRLPVQGRVEKEIKGGYEVRIGHARGFCPFSQMDVVRGEPAMYIGHVHEFRITEFTDGGRNLVLSRRVLLEASQKADAAKVRASIVAGAVATGRVVSVREFGAFVDLGGGVQGLLHVSDMGWSRVSDPSHIVKPGQEITVKVLAVDEQAQKISLGLKQLAEDPWSRAADTYAIGQVRKGRVTRVTEFGAFVELEPGVEGLAHASTFAPGGRRDAWTTRIMTAAQEALEAISEARFATTRGKAIECWQDVLGPSFRG